MPRLQGEGFLFSKTSKFQLEHYFFTKSNLALVQSWNRPELSPESFSIHFQRFGQYRKVPSPISKEYFTITRVANFPTSALAWEEFPPKIKSNFPIPHLNSEWMRKCMSAEPFLGGKASISNFPLPRFIKAPDFQTIQFADNGWRFYVERENLRKSLIVVSRVFDVSAFWAWSLSPALL